MKEKLPRNFISCSVCGCAGCNIALGIDCNHSDCVMIIAIEFGGINVSINAIGSDWLVWTAKSGRIWFNILKIQSNSKEIHEMNAKIQFAHLPKVRLASIRFPLLPKFIGFHRCQWFIAKSHIDGEFSRSIADQQCVLRIFKNVSSHADGIFHISHWSNRSNVHCFAVQ